jgi:thioredoxin-related protein
MTALAPNYGFDEIPQEDGVERVKALHAVVVDDYEAAVANAKNEGKLLLVNFTGFNCSNCRAVERGIMPQKTIAPILTEHFVEARLHIDNPKADRQAARTGSVHLQLRQDLVEGRTTTPTYVSVDPNIGKPIVEHILSGGPTAWEKGYRAFLEESLKATGRALPEAAK